MASDLKRRYKEWEEWAITADQNDDGWQEDYPRPKWKLLMDAAIYEMARNRAYMKIWDLSDLKKSSSFVKSTGMPRDPT